MELLYNPDRMSEEEIRKTFVARQPLVDELVSLIEHQPDGAGVQHVVIIAPRGMGKTTVLLMVKFTLKDRSLADRWQAVKFPEESYGVYDLADFWIEVLELLAHETGDDAPRRQAEELKRKYPRNDDLQEAAFAAIKDWRRKHGKRLVLLVENLDMLLEQINDDRDNARLRDVMMNDGTVMILGGATTFFKEARAYDQPLYNFFKLYDLADLRFGQMEDLLRQRAALDKVPNFEATLKANASRLRVLEYFTGGNPRLALMLYRVVTQLELGEVQSALEKLLDEVTPFYKAKIESLPAQQRKIMDHIARISGQTNEGLTPGEIAQAVRLAPNQVSAQLKRLSEEGYVRVVNLRGRRSYYTLSEPLYAIWHQMRFGRGMHQRMLWLVNFIKAWYSARELRAEDKKLRERFRQHLDQGFKSDACDALEHRLLLAEAMKDAHARSRIRDGVVESYLELSIAEKQPDETLSYIDRALEISPKDHDAWLVRGRVLGSMGRYEEAIASFTRALESRPACGNALLGRGSAFFNSYHYREAAKDYKQVTEINPSSHQAWCSYMAALNNTGRYEEALAVWEQAEKTGPECRGTWYCRAFALEGIGQYEKAVAICDDMLKIKPDDERFWFRRGQATSKLGHLEEAISSYDRALKIDHNDYLAWYERGVALAHLERYEEAIISIDRALEIEPDYRRAWFVRGRICIDKIIDMVSQEKLNLARQNWTEALESGRRSEDKGWPDVVSNALLSVAQIGQLRLAKQLLIEAKMEEQLFPLARALDYLLTGDEALVEKLSPEVKGIVEEVIAKLRPAAGKPKPGQGK
jgi:tetratricopeptide (TPR) repeat protein